MSVLNAPAKLRAKHDPKVSPSKGRSVQYIARKPQWTVENWTQNGNFVGYRVVRGENMTFEVAPNGGFVVDIYARSSDDNSRESSRDKAGKLCSELNRLINSGDRAAKAEKEEFE